MRSTHLILIAAILFTPTFVLAGINSKNFGTFTCSEVTSVYDGDTFRCNIDGWPGIVGERMMIRILGIDTPELRDKRPEIKALALKAKQFAVEQLRNAGQVELKNMHRGKYFRILADVYFDGQDLGKLLIEEGLAKPYDGGKKNTW